MSAPPPPPPTRTVKPASTPFSATTTDPPPRAWKARLKSLGAVGLEKGIKVSDWAGGHMNNLAEKAGSERFYPTTGDFPLEMDKAARILRAFTVDGLETTISTEVKGIKRQQKVLRKIPPAIIQSASGLAIFTSMRTGIAPFGGAGGSGVVVAKLPDGTWSAPSCMSPNNLSTGLMFGVDIYDAVLIIRTQQALDSFKSHKATLGSDIGIAAGPFGMGGAAEMGLEKAPVLSYVRSRGLYAGVQLVGQVFVDRFDENAAMYHWPGIKAGDILAGKVRVPHEAASLQRALQDAESGKAQTLKGNTLDVAIIPSEQVALDSIELEEGEVLRLPPTPTMTAEEEARDKAHGLEIGEEEMEMIRQAERQGRLSMPLLPHYQEAETWHDPAGDAPGIEDGREVVGLGMEKSEAGLVGVGIDLSPKAGVSDQSSTLATTSTPPPLPSRSGPPSRIASPPIIPNDEGEAVPLSATSEKELLREKFARDAEVERQTRKDEAGLPSYDQQDPFQSDLAAPATFAATTEVSTPPSSTSDDAAAVAAPVAVHSIPPAPSYPPVLPPPSHPAVASAAPPSLPARRRVPPPPTSAPLAGEESKLDGLTSGMEDVSLEDSVGGERKGEGVV